MRPSRRGIRRNAEPITTVEQFEDFIFAGTEFALPLYVDLLRGLMSTAAESASLFTHGDIRPAHSMIKHDDGGSHHWLGGQHVLLRLLGGDQNDK